MYYRRRCTDHRCADSRFFEGGHHRFNARRGIRIDEILHFIVYILCAFDILIHRGLGREFAEIMIVKFDYPHTALESRAVDIEAGALALAHDEALVFADKAVVVVVPAEGGDNVAFLAQSVKFARILARSGRGLIGEVAVAFDKALFVYPIILAVMLPETLGVGLAALRHFAEKLAHLAHRDMLDKT